MAGAAEEKEQLSIGIICPYSFDEPGGVQAHILDLSQELRQRGHRVQVLGPATDAADLPDFVHRGGPAIPISYNGSVARLAWGPQVGRHIEDFIAGGQFDVLHIHEPNSPSYSLAALRRAHGPIVATYHAAATSSVALRLVRPALRPFLDKIRGGIAVSEVARRWQVEQLGGDPVLIPNGVDTSVFAAARARAEAAAPAASDGHRPIEVVFLGRLDEPRKGLDILLQALDQVRAPLELTVIGGGTPRNHSGRIPVNFVGRVSDADKAEILGRADIYVAPNLGGESFGIVLVEAMAAGCAVIASDLEAFADVIAADGPTPAGKLFRTGSPADLARILDQVAGDEQLRRQLRQAAIERATQFDWSTVAAAVEQVYRTVADGTTVTTTPPPRSGATTEGSSHDPS